MLNVKIYDTINPNHLNIAIKTALVIPKALLVLIILHILLELCIHNIVDQYLKYQNFSLNFKLK